MAKAGMGEDAVFKWGIKNVKQLEQWIKGLRVEKKYYTFKIDGLKLGIRDKMLAFLSDSMDIQYMVHLKFDGKCP